MQPIARVTMVCALALSSGCAATAKGRAIQTVVVSDAVADEVSSLWDGFVSRRIDKCRKQNYITREEREACLGPAADGEILASALDSLVLVQKGVRDGVKCEEVKVCLKEVDWKALYEDATALLLEVRRIHEEMKKE
jgi:hypothetical protein